MLTVRDQIYYKKSFGGIIFIVKMFRGSMVYLDSKTQLYLFFFLWRHWIKLLQKFSHPSTLAQSDYSLLNMPDFILRWFRTFIKVNLNFFDNV